jgi:uncharacterized metal-binding protein (TIGR02443 family)
MVFSTKKRFIAGVVCPKCSEMDKLMAFSLNGEDYRECITCGFKDKLRLASSPKEMQTRVNMTKDQIKSETSLVRIIEPKE